MTGIEYLRRTFYAAMLRLMRRRRAARGAPRLAVFPGDTIGDLVIANGVYEDELLEALFSGPLAGHREVFADGVALDVGANVGNHTLYFARRCAQVLAFEPNPIAAALIDASLRMNGIGNVTVVPVGLGERAGEATFFLHSKRNLGASGTGELSRRGSDASFTVDLRAGDEVLAQSPLKATPVVLVKVDVEGSELAVLRGLGETLSWHRPVVLFESHRATGEGGSDAICDFLESCGYTHFHVAERDIDAIHNRPLRALVRLVRGVHFRIRPVDRPEDRTHQLIIATERALG